MSLSIHDNHLYAQVVDFERRTIVLHTTYPHPPSPEFTDVVFEGVVMFHFEQQMASILFDITEADLTGVLKEHESLLERTRNNGWPLPEWKTIDDLATKLTAGGAKCFKIHSSYGIDGFVVAKTMDFRSRSSRAL